MASKQVLVIGGGIAGVAVALELATTGCDVFLLEREAAIGGHAASFCCKATDTCSNCSACVAFNRTREALTHPGISVLTNSTVRKVKGTAGNFHIEIIQRAQYINSQECISCGLCTEVCPAEPKAIYLPSQIATSYFLDENRCLRFKGKDCHLCQQVCPTGAIDLTRTKEAKELDAGAIIVATGFEVFNASEKGSLGYGSYPDVLSGLDMERMFQRGGGVKLASGKKPESVAFIQCVGSRDESQNKGYCSQVCCKYAIRFASLIKHQSPETKVTIFYIDLQTAGKGFAEFFEKYKQKIQFVRGIPVEVDEVPGGLKVRYEDLLQGKRAEQVFDMVVLSAGIMPGRDSWTLARALGINLDGFGFLEGRDGGETNVEGIFVAGTCQGPKDIPGSIAQGVAAAGMAARVVSEPVKVER